MSIRLFGEDAGRPVHEITIRSKAGAEAKILSWGAVVRDLIVPSKTGPQRVVLGLNSLEDYIAHSPHYGALAGRFANRIRNGRFTLDGETYQLDQNAAFSLSGFMGLSVFLEWPLKASSASHAAEQTSIL